MPSRAVARSDPGRAGLRRAAALVPALLLPVLALAQPAPSWDQPPERWLEAPREPARPHVPSLIDGLRGVPPPTNVLLMVGGRAAWPWRLDKWFSDFRTANVGFGGSYVTDATYFIDELIRPYEPSTILMAMGDDDLAAGKPADQVRDDLRAFAGAVRRVLPHTQLVFVSLRPSVAAWDDWPAMQRLNAGVEAWAADQPDVHYVDVTRVTLASDGRPRPELYHDDGARPTELAYLEWSLLVKPVVDAAESRYRMLEGCDRWGCGALR